MDDDEEVRAYYEAQQRGAKNAARKEERKRRAREVRAGRPCTRPIQPVPWTLQHLDCMPPRKRFACLF